MRRRQILARVGGVSASRFLRVAGRGLRLRRGCAASAPRRAGFRSDRRHRLHLPGRFGCPEATSRPRPAVRRAQPNAHPRILHRSPRQRTPNARGRRAFLPRDPISCGPARDFSRAAGCREDLSASPYYTGKRVRVLSSPLGTARRGLPERGGVLGDVTSRPQQTDRPGRRAGRRHPEDPRPRGRGAPRGRAAGAMEGGPGDPERAQSSQSATRTDGSSRSGEAPRIAGRDVGAGTEAAQGRIGRSAS